MKTVIDSLTKLDPILARSVKCMVASLYKIDKEHRLFINLKNKHSVLEDAEYVVYPNINNLMMTKFLDKDGAELLSYSDGVSEFILLSFDSEVKHSSISITNPYVMNPNSNTIGSLSWC